MPEAGQVQVELTPQGVPSAVWVVTPQRPLHRRRLRRAQDRRLWREIATELAESLRKDGAQVRIEDGPWGREVVGVASRSRLRRRSKASPGWCGSSASTATAG